MRKGKAADAKDLHEDDWRQIEFVAKANASAVEQRLAELEFFKKAHETEGGWNQVYLRSEYGLPIRVPPLAGYQPGLPLTVGGSLVEGGFAFPDPESGWFLYGTADGLLALSPAEGPSSLQFAEWLGQLANTHELLLVDWYGVRQVDTSSTDSIYEWTDGYSS